MKFDIEDYNSCYVMHCKTKTQAEYFTSFLDSLGKRWSDGTSYLTLTYYEDYGKEICYHFTGGYVGNKEYFSDNGYIILEFDEFDWDRFKFRGVKVSKEAEACLINFLNTFCINR